MAAAATVAIQEPEEFKQWEDDPPKFEEQELDILAFQLWQRASCPENPVGENWMSEEEALRSHRSCL
jgi:hypothetical protein